MRALITGGTGFIGSWIAKALVTEGTDVRVLDINADLAVASEILGRDAAKVEFRTGDITNAPALVDAASGCDVLIHLAAILTPDCQMNPVRGAEICLIGSLNVFEAARAHGINRLLYMSSAGVFGPADGVTPRPTTLYGAYKLAVEGVARAYWQDHRIKSVGFRPLVVYGPGRETGLTAGPSLACKAAARGGSYTIPFSGGTDFVYVEDVATAYVEAGRLPRDGAHVYNIVGETGTAEGFAAGVAKVAPGSSIRAAGPSLPIAPEIEAGPLREDFPAIPRTSIADGITKTVAHYKSRAKDDVL
ncbi:MAG TPA: NAD(P)-dependent oxidoreductase [Hyphomicrobiaceae bacterium]|nr:NAD(P)-dependent oxidoreductase [Hyphomicrobiaceae bacterium]